ncbi:hypothetical protein J3F83DRAFT_579788 [Trichoderma novae-zelandiae]
MPHAITILEKMPINKNGKIDRKALASRSKTHLLPAQGSIRKPKTNTERAMQKIWAKVLNINHSFISIHNSLFHLRGNSITAIRVVSRARKVGLSLVVADVFNWDTLEQLAGHCIKVGQDDEDIRPAALVPPPIKDALLDKIDRLNVTFRGPAVADILPITDFQHKTLTHGITTGQHANYFFLDLGADLDVEKLKASCAMTVEKFPILRACFLLLSGKFWQVILRNRSGLAPVQIQHVNEDLDKASDRYCSEDVPRLTSLELPLAFVLLRHPAEGSRLIVRLSHAQYDGIAFPLIFHCLMDSYRGIEYAAGPDFSRFLSHKWVKRESSIRYWKAVLDGSSPPGT